MFKRKSTLTESRETTAERIGKAAMAQIESETEYMRSKTERLRALRLEGGGPGDETPLNGRLTRQNATD